MKTSILIIVLSVISAFGVFAQGTWSTASSEGLTPGTYMTSHVINGKVYVVGGDSSYIALSRFNVYDPATDTWSAPVTTGTFRPHTFHTSSVVNGKIYVIGGWNNDVAPFEPVDIFTTIDVFDVATSHWSTITPQGKHTPRFLATSCVVNGKIYVIAGDTNSWLPTDIVEIYDPATNTWETPSIEGQLIEPRAALTSVAIGNKIYIMGGSGYVNSKYFGLEVFDATANTWEIPLTQGTFTPRGVFSSCTFDGKIYTVGGFTTKNFPGMEVFDVGTSTWETPVTQGTFTPRGWLTSSLVQTANEFEIYAIAGANNSVTLNTNEVFRPATNAVNTASNVLDILVTPNPTDNLVTIHYLPPKLINVSIVDVFGNTVTERSGHQEQSLTFDLSGSPAGVYYARINIPSLTIVKKILHR
jgi:N-acetylneuraminic acid mutarotase